MKKIFLIFGIVCFALIGYFSAANVANAGSLPAQFEVIVTDQNGSGISGLPVTFGSTVTTNTYPYNCPVNAFWTTNVLPNNWYAGMIFGVAQTPLNQSTLSNGYAGSWYHWWENNNTTSYGFTCACNNQKVTLNFSSTSSYNNWRITSVTGLVSDNRNPWVDNNVPINNITTNSFDYKVNNDQGVRIKVKVAPPAPIINGACETPPNGGTFSTAPSGTLCKAGTASPSSLSGSGPWAWTCSGSNGGTNASCSTSSSPACTFSASSETIKQGYAVTLSWAFTNFGSIDTNSIHLWRGTEIGPVLGASGSRDDVPLKTTDYDIKYKVGGVEKTCGIQHVDVKPNSSGSATQVAP